MFEEIKNKVKKIIKNYNKMRNYLKNNMSPK